MENVIIQGILFPSADEITHRDVDIDKIIPEKPYIIQSFQQLSYKEAKEKTLQRFNFYYIGDLLAVNNGNITQTARSCGLECQALKQIMRRYGMKADTYEKKVIEKQYLSKRGGTIEKKDACNADCSFFGHELSSSCW